MNTKITLVISFLTVLAAILFVNNAKQENFDATGLVFNKPPEWFHKQPYDLNQWLVTYNPDQVSIPGGCDMHYRGDPNELNYMSSAYRFWRM